MFRMTFWTTFIRMTSRVYSSSIMVCYRIPRCRIYPDVNITVVYIPNTENYKSLSECDLDELESIPTNSYSRSYSKLCLVVPSSIIYFRNGKIKLTLHLQPWCKEIGNPRPVNCAQPKTGICQNILNSAVPVFPCSAARWEIAIPTWMEDLNIF